MPSGRVDTMSDYLRQIMGSISEAKLVADADLPFLLNLEQQIVDKMRDPITKMQQAGIMPAAQNQIPAGGAPASPADMGMPSTPSSLMGAGGVRGVPTGPGSPNPDELRRILGQ